jgi:putative PIN family toxin of toxin-antitoxin system
MTGRRIVLDTNIVVSAALKREGLEAQLVEMIASGLFVLCASAEVLAEYGQVLGRPKFSTLGARHVAQLLALLGSRAQMVTPTSRVLESSDEPDNRFLECAEAADADFLITGNAKHFPKKWKTTQIVNTRDLLRAFRLA